MDPQALFGYYYACYFSLYYILGLQFMEKVTNGLNFLVVVMVLIVVEMMLHFL